jgi:hypothetical protein
LTFNEIAACMSRLEAGAQGHLNATSGVGWWNEGRQLLDRVIAASAGQSGHPFNPCEARSILAINATDAAQEHYLLK